MRKLCLGLSIATMVLLAACGGDNGSSADDFVESSSSGESLSSSKNVVLVDPSTVVVGTMTDERDGQTYKTVKIGNQTWMAENLNYRYQGPTADLDSSSFCYDDDPANCETYGRLYLWSAAMDSAGIIKGNAANGCGYYSECLSGEIVRGVCPKGWHLPDTTEWIILFNAVGGSSTAGIKLKSTSGWKDYEGDSGNGDDTVGFSALPAGSRYYHGGFNSDGYGAYFWSATEYDSDVTYNMRLYYGYEDAYLSNYSKYDAFSVRCIKD